MNRNHFFGDTLQDIGRKQGTPIYRRNSKPEAVVSLKRNLILLGCYFAALVFMSLPFTLIETDGPPSTFAQVEAR